MRTPLVSVAAGIGMMLSATTAFAAASADVQVQMQAPSSVQISTATAYAVTVQNKGPSTATSVNLVIEFPLTDTSPTVAILGTVTESDTRCVIASNKITCAFGTLKKGKSASVSYAYTAPVSTKPLQMKATVSSAVSDNNPANNFSTIIPNLVYPSRSILSANVVNSHCTGTNLTSYFECLLFPSSISSHITTLNADHTIEFSDPSYSGIWSQNTAKTSLSFSYYQSTTTGSGSTTGSGTTKVAEFNGYAINGSNCFDGLTTFFPEPSTYVSPYRVCIQ